MIRLEWADTAALLRAAWVHRLNNKNSRFGLLSDYGIANRRFTGTAVEFIPETIGIIESVGTVGTVETVVMVDAVSDN